MQPNNVTAYIDYFRQLAVSHKDLRHDPITEEGKGDSKKKRFCTFGNEEVIKGLRTQISFPALILELYDNTGSFENVYDIRQSPKGAFMVIDNAKPGDFKDEERAYATSEGIVYDILKKIWQDHYGRDKDRCETPFKQFRWNLEITPTGKLFQNEYGYYVQFSFDFQNTINITEAPAAGTFI